MANQIIIDIGAVANDGTGDPLRTAFNYVNNNFSNVWESGVANSNISFSGNKILTTNVNGNLVLAPNGIGKVQANVDIVPNANNTLSLGSLTRQWNTVYAQNLDVGGNVTFADLTVDGNLTVVGNTIQIGNIVTDTKTIQLANTAGTTTAANGSGITVGANDNIATLLYNSTSNVWTTNIGISATGNISVAYINVADNVTVQNDVSAKRGTFTGDSVTGDASLYIGSPSFTNLGTDVMAQFTGNVPSYAQLNLQNYGNSNTSSGDYIITADNGTDSTHFLNLGLTGSNWNGTQPNSLGNRLGPNDGYLYVQDGDFVLGTINGTIETWKFDTTGNLTVPGDIIPTANNTQSLGSATNQWNDLYISNATIFMNNVPIGLSAGNVLTVNGNAVLQNNSNTTISTTGNITAGNVLTGGAVNATGNVTGNYFIGNGSQLTGLSISSISNGTSNVSIATANGNATITANAVTYTFGTDSTLTLPGGSRLRPLGANLDIFAGTGSYVNLITSDESSYMGVGGAGGYVVTAGGTWNFNTNGNLTAPGNISATGNVSGAYVKGNGSELTNLPAPTVAQDIASTGAMSIMTYDGNLKYVSYATVEPASGNITGGNILTGGLISATGNITGGNLTVGSGTITGGNVNGAIFNGNVAFGTGTVGGSGNIAGGNISATGNVTAGNIVTSGSGGDITMSGGNITGAGNISAGNVNTTGNVTAANFFGNGATLSNVATQVKGSWTVTTGTNNYSFTVPVNNTYQLWVNGNIPNGIIVYNATVSVSNTNVPVIGQQFAWNYEGAGNPIVFTSIPAQIIGTANAISNANPSVGTTTNTFTFGINNSSGNTVTVNYGYTKIS